ncbi:MAG: hypothetical protein K0S07_924 [Chlamydiales bacterium]|nr:hypothetical protein [Chlamydiales bacterium]
MGHLSVNERQKKEMSKFDSKEFDLPETMLVRDIENKVFQSIALHCLSTIEGIALAEGNFIDSLLGRNPSERVKSIHVEQDSKKHSVNVKVEVDVCYGIPIPEKASEIQNKLMEEITRLTGLHVASVHVVFKNLCLTPESSEYLPESALLHEKKVTGEEYSDEF